MAHVSMGRYPCWPNLLNLISTPPEVNNKIILTNGVLHPRVGNFGSIMSILCWDPYELKKSSVNLFICKAKMTIGTTTKLR